MGWNLILEVYKIKIANYVIGIEGIHVYPHSNNYMFKSNENTDIIVKITNADIEKEKEYFFERNKEYCSSIGVLEVSAIQRKVCNALLEHNVFLLHGAAISVNNMAYVFSGPSGVGKTTHIRKWLKECSDSFVINGDKPLIKIDGAEEQPMVCGSPWAGKENMCSNTISPLKSIILMERAEHNRVEKISFLEAFPMLFQQVYRPFGKTETRKVLELLKKLEITTEFYRLEVNNFEENSFNIAFSGICS